jgi:AraC family transcriptional regulator, regulatory protein of adaptative response / DNA-3-methyladenine glycosylase II
VKLDFDTCYRALLARDPRFDGRFFTAVTSTGIYCRPICPARTPARRNIRFYPHAGAAEAAGFRACRRCRPEASPGSPEWDTRADIAARAVRLIGDGYVDEHGVAGLARRLAVTERHLHRLLTAELGAGPLALARTTRLQTARRLLAETPMPVTEVAFASGFASVRQFNDSFRQAYGQPPSAVRGPRMTANGHGPRGQAPSGGPCQGPPPDTARDRAGGLRGHAGLSAAGEADGLEETGKTRRSTAGRSGAGRQDGAGDPGGTGGPGGTWLTLKLPYRAPFDAGSLLGFFAARAVPGVEEVAGNRYRRAVRTPGGPGIIELIPPAAGTATPSPLSRNAVPRNAVPRNAVPRNAAPQDAAGPGAGQMLLRAHLPRLRGIGQVVARCRHLFDLDADPHAIGAVLAADGVLAPLVAARPGLRVAGAYDGFELAVRAVLGQQVSVAAARTLAGRLAARFGTPLGTAGGDSGPALLFPTAGDLAGEDLAGLGLTTARQATLRALAGAVASGRISLDHGTDPAGTAALLAELPGIGPWTVSYILMRAAGDPDAYPASDLGLRRALARLGCEPGRAARWRPWRAYAAAHLWAWEAAGGHTPGG